MDEFKADSMRELLTWLKDQGHSISRPAQILGVAHATLRAECSRVGVEFPHNQKPRGRKAPCMRHRSRLLPYAGEMLSMNEVSRRTGIGRTTIKFRIDVLGWTPEKAVSTPVMGKGDYGHRTIHSRIRKARLLEESRPHGSGS